MDRTNILLVALNNEYFSLSLLDTRSKTRINFISIRSRIYLSRTMTKDKKDEMSLLYNFCSVSSALFRLLDSYVVEITRVAFDRSVNLVHFLNFIRHLKYSSVFRLLLYLKRKK